MCTLTYRLTEQGYEIFFNRDEQKTRPQAIQPTMNTSLNAIYPIDPSGGGTWIAAHQSGVSLALLNYYQAHIDPNVKDFTSRGILIPYLLSHYENIHQQLIKMDLSIFQAFQLCVFASDLSIQEGKQANVMQYIWNGNQLTYSTLSVESALPITSSGVDYPVVFAARKQQFNLMISQQSTTSDYVAYHNYQGESGKCSVKMFRDDAHTVSFTQISVDQSKVIGEKVRVEYVDHLVDESNKMIFQL